MLAKISNQEFRVPVTTNMMTEDITSLGSNVAPTPFVDLTKATLINYLPT